MSKEYRSILLFLSITILLIISYFINNSIIPPIQDFWFSSGILLLILLSLIDQPHFSKDANIFINAATAGISLLLVSKTDRDWIFSTFVFFISYLFISSYLLIWFRSNPLNEENKFIQLFTRLNRNLGKPTTIFSSFFLWGSIKQFGLNSNESIALFWYWFIFMIFNIPALAKTIEDFIKFQTKQDIESSIGSIFGVQSKKIFLTKLYEKRKTISKFDIVQFRYSMQDSDDYLVRGIIFDTYLLNESKWAKILQLDIVKKTDENLEKNIVYKINSSDQLEVSKELSIDRFVGIVIEGSGIGKIKFEYSKKTDNLQEGDLIELKIGNKKYFYQVLNGFTTIERLEERNESGFIEGEAIQLGEWINKELHFRKFGWVPSVNTPIFLATTDDIAIPKISKPEYKLGLIPNTKLPSVMNLDLAISYHLAILGITGSGKSFIAKEIIEQIQYNMIVVIVDFTSEWKKKLEKSNPKLNLNETNIVNFLTSGDKIGIVELPSLSNTADVLKSTEKVFEKIFNYAKSCYDKGTPIKICLVLEEAHTITPETSFLGDMGDYGSSKSVVNKMSQVALQGRKYGVGLLVIAQRTANVSKTVLTQCNSIICFQAFDETSFNFLGNYVGKEFVQALPNLKQYHAIVAGKAFKSSLPMIINLER